MREWVFKWRGYVLIPSALVVLALCRPTTASFTCGLLVAVLGEALRIWGVGYSGLTTRSSQVQAPELVTAGPYAFVRNPLYIGNFITALGFAIVAAGGLCPATRWFLFLFTGGTYITVYGLIVPLEEEYLARTFGEPYFEYRRRVPRWTPRLTPYPDMQGRFDWRAIAQGEIHTLALFVLVGSVMAYKLFLSSTLFSQLLHPIFH